MVPINKHAIELSRYRGENVEAYPSMDPNSLVVSVFFAKVCIQTGVNNINHHGINFQKLTGIFTKLCPYLTYTPIPICYNVGLYNYLRKKSHCPLTGLKYLKLH